MAGGNANKTPFLSLIVWHNKLGHFVSPQVKLFMVLHTEDSLVSLPWNIKSGYKCLHKHSSLLWCSKNDSENNI